MGVTKPPETSVMVTRKIVASFRLAGQQLIVHTHFFCFGIFPGDKVSFTLFRVDAYSACYASPMLLNFGACQITGVHHSRMLASSLAISQYRLPGHRRISKMPQRFSRGHNGYDSRNKVIGPRIEIEVEMLSSDCSWTGCDCRISRSKL